MNSNIGIHEEQNRRNQLKNIFFVKFF